MSDCFEGLLILQLPLVVEDLFPQFIPIFEKLKRAAGIVHLDGLVQRDLEAAEIERFEKGIYRSLGDIFL